MASDMCRSGAPREIFAAHFFAVPLPPTCRTSPAARQLAGKNMGDRKIPNRRRDGLQSSHHAPRDEQPGRHHAERDDYYGREFILVVEVER
jgi:hypothetical protein